MASKRVTTGTEAITVSVPGGHRQEGGIDAQQGEGARQALLDRRAEDQLGIGRQAEPGIAGHLVLELARAPAGVAQGHQQLARTLAPRHRLEDVARGGEAHAVGHRHGGVPVAQGLMQHETAVGLDRTAEEHRAGAERLGSERQLDALEQGAQGDLGGAVDDQAERAARVVLGDIDDRAGEVRVGHAGHGQQELMGEVGRQRGGHGGQSRRAPPADDPWRHCGEIVKTHPGWHNPPPCPEPE